jgi:hypothetical protein
MPRKIATGCYFAPKSIKKWVHVIYPGEIWLVESYYSI